MKNRKTKFYEIRMAITNIKDIAYLCKNGRKTYYNIVPKENETMQFQNLESACLMANDISRYSNIESVEVWYKGTKKEEFKLVATFDSPMTMLAKNKAKSAIKISLGKVTKVRKKTYLTPTSHVIAKDIFYWLYGMRR